MLVVDPNVLVYAIDQRAKFHDLCRRRLHQAGKDPSPTFMTWSICYEFLRVVTHPRTHESPWSPQDAWSFIRNLLLSGGFRLLSATDRHQAVLTRTLSELPHIRSSLIHDLHIAVLMREHGVSRICTRDKDFYRFPFLEVVDPVLE